jgi:hypothetical protein
MWLIVGATIFSILGLAALAAIEINGKYNQSWVSFVLIAVLYIPIQIITEGILSVYWESPRWIIKIIPIIFLFCFYWVVLYFK